MKFRTSHRQRFDPSCGLKLYMPSAAPKTVFYDTADGRRLAARVWEPQAAPPFFRALFWEQVSRSV